MEPDGLGTVKRSGVDAGPEWEVMGARGVRVEPWNGLAGCGGGHRD